MTTNERTTGAANETADVRERKLVNGERVRPVSAAAVRIVFAMVAANAATQFAIQAWMSFRFARDVWRIPSELCVAVIVALDLFAVTYMVFTYLLRTARKRTRAYVWLVFAVGVGAQLFAAELYGAHEQWTEPVRVFAALPALFLAASLHGLIIWRNHASTHTEPIADESPARRESTSAEQEAGAAPVTQRPPRPTTPPAVPPVSSGARALRRSRSTGKTGGQSHRDAAAVRVIAGESTRSVASDLQVSNRAIQIWVKEYRERNPEPPASVFTQSDPQSINGFAFGAATEAQVN
jgi:hypothetical protein